MVAIVIGVTMILAGIIFTMWILHRIHTSNIFYDKPVPFQDVLRVHEENRK